MTPAPGMLSLEIISLEPSTWSYISHEDFHVGMPCTLLQGLEGFLPPPRAPSPAPTQLDPAEVDVQELGGFLDPETPPRAARRQHPDYTPP